jgi:hypothetical protein
MVLVKSSSSYPKYLPQRRASKVQRFLGSKIVTSAKLPCASVLGAGIAFPTVPEGKARIRTIMTATHTKEELQQAVEVLGRVGKKMGIVS